MAWTRGMMELKKNGGILDKRLKLALIEFADGFNMERKKGLKIN